MLDNLGGWLREQRQARGWGVSQMARRLQQAGKANSDTHIPGTATLATYVRRWEHGKVAPTERYRLHYCKALEIQPTEFGPRPSPEQPLPRNPASPDPGSVQTAPGVRPGAGPPYWPSEPSRYRELGTGHRTAERTEQQSHANLSLGHLMTMLAEESQDFGEWADTSNIADTTLEHYATQVRRLASDYQHAPPYPLLLETKRLRDRVFAKLQGHQRPGQTRDLYLIAAQACGLLAWMSGDLGYQRAAQTHAWTAWVCADHANHDGARAWVRVTQSKLAYWDDRYVESAQLAEDGLRYPSADSGGAMLALLKARALARLGRDREAAEALAQAATGLEQAGPDEIGGLYGLSQARYHHLAGSTHLGRQDAGQVLAETRQALMLFGATPVRERYYSAETGTRMDEAHAHLLLRDIDGAKAALGPVLTLPPGSRNGPLTQHLGRVRQALAQPEFRDAVLTRELQEEIETFCRESIVNDLRG